MEIKKALEKILPSSEDDETKHQHLLAFYDFCCDLFEERYGTMTPDGEFNSKFVKGLLVHT
jgi:hypothetical protein